MNGLIAFVFPISLCYYVFVIRNNNSQINQSNNNNKNKKIQNEKTEERKYDIELSNIVHIEKDSNINESDTHEALLPFLLPYRPTIILVIFVMFFIMIVTTILMDIKEQLE